MVQDKWQFQTEGAKIVGKILDCDFSLDELWYDGMFSKTSFFERAYPAVSNDELYCLCDYIKNETADKFWAWFKKNEGIRHFHPAPMNTSELDKKDQKIVQDLSNIYVKVDNYKFRILKKSSQYVAPEDWLKKSINKKPIEMSEKWKMAAEFVKVRYMDSIEINSVVIVENDHRLLCFAKGTLYIPKIAVEKEIELLRTYTMYKKNTTGEVEKEAFSTMVRSLLQKIESLNLLCPKITNLKFLNSLLLHKFLKNNKNFK